MQFRFASNPVIKGLFSNIPIESGLTDQEIVCSVAPRIPHKTFSRLKLKPPASFKSEQLLMIARFTQSQMSASSADVLHLIRGDVRHAPPALQMAVMARTYSRGAKPCLEASEEAERIASLSSRILMFDRDNSIEYLRSTESDPSEDESTADPAIPPGQSGWTWSSARLRYERNPRVFVVLIANSLRQHVRRDGDTAIEHLIGNVESGEHSLSVIADCPKMAHRIFRGVFAVARSVVIFDRSAMFVLPEHGNSVRLYEARQGAEHTRLITDAIRHYRHMRRFRSHTPTAGGVRKLLRRHLSYRFPHWK